MRIECQHAVPHTTRSSELSVFEREQVNQRVRIDVIEVVTGRNVRALSAEERGKVRILAIEVHNVSIKAPLLEQIGTSRQVRNPRLGLFCPGLVAVEPLTEGSEGESGLFVEQGLMNRCVKHEAVQTHGQFLVCGWLERRRRPRPCADDAVSDS